MPANQSNAASDFYRQAMASLKKGQLFDAETSIVQAISLEEANAEYWMKLGIIWGKMNRFQEAVEASTMAANLAPDNPDAAYNLGVAYLQAGNNDLGIPQMEKSFKMAPSHQLAENLGDIFFQRGMYQNAAYYYLHIYKDKKLSASETILSKLAKSLYHNGDLTESLNITLGLLNRFPKNETYISLLLDLHRRVPYTVFRADAKKIIENLLNRENTKFLFLRSPWVSLFLLDPAHKDILALAGHAPASIDLKKLTPVLTSDFICRGLEKGIATHAGIESIMANLRQYLLLHWERADTWPPALLRFVSSLAVCCWYNDFVYFETDAEKKAVVALKDQVSSTAEMPENIRAVQIALLACYMPLYDFLADEKDLRLSNRFLKILDPLITAQLRFPLAERALIPTIPDFTVIEDKTSLSVQEMYAARPYPRWISTSVEKLPPDLQELTRGLNVLVAGCGTGHEPALYAITMPFAHITAIDLSLPSIAYGKRMALKLHIDKQIEFFHGDLMKVGELNRSFDFVASSGVLHHLKDPEKGLKAILATLKPQGRLSISLYSKAARDQFLGPAEQYIKDKGYSSSLDDIRAFRQDVMHMTPDNPVTFCTRAGDFFNLAECNDLLFHVQEHRYTPHMIWDMAERHGLEPVTVSVTSERMKMFKDMFPDGNMLDPDRLTAFEEKYPNAFVEMFKIFFRRKGETEPHPLDRLIKSGLI